MLVAADLQRPNAVNQLQVNGERVGVPVFAPEPGNGVGDPVDGGPRLDRGGQAQAPRRRHRRHRRPPRRRRRDDAAGRRHPRRGPARRDPLRRRRDDRPGRRHHGAGLPRRRRLRRRRPHQARRRRPRWCGPVDRLDHRQAGHVRLQRREDDRLRPVPPRPDGLAHPRHGRHAHPDRAGREDLRPGAGRSRPPRSSAARAASSPSTTSSSRCSRSASSARCRRSWGCCPGWGSSASSSRTSTSARSTASRRSSSR